MVHIKRIDEMRNNKNNLSDEEVFLSGIGFKSFEDIQRAYKTDWYDRSSYGGGKQTFIPNIIPMKIIASAVGRYMKSDQNVTVRPDMMCTRIMGCNCKPFFGFIVKHNGKEATIHFEDGRITHYGEDMDEPAITVHYDRKMETIWGADRYRRKFGDTDWHESEMAGMSDKLLQVLNNIL